MVTRRRIRTILDYLGITNDSSGASKTLNAVVMLVLGTLLIVIGLFTTIFYTGMYGGRISGISFVFGVLFIGIGWLTRARAR